MSEFSDAYFLFDTPVDAAIPLLRKLGRFALVFPRSHNDGRWSPILIDGCAEAGAPAQQFVDIAQGVWMHYAFADDHGLWLRFFRGSTEVVHIELNRRGPSENAIDTVIEALRKLDVVPIERQQQLHGILKRACATAPLELEQVRRQLGDVLGMELLANISCADLSTMSIKALQRMLPTVHMVLKSKRGQVDKNLPQPPPNRFCPVPDLPPFMYLPVPEGDADSILLERHVRHWLDTRDFDDEAQEGFWLLTAYGRALPTRYGYLANRVMNLGLAFPHAYEEALEDTLRAILAVTPAEFDWTPYLERKKGCQRL